MLRDADAKELHELKHVAETAEVKIEPKLKFSKEKTRHRRLKSLESKFHNQRYKILKNLFQKVQEDYRL